MNKINSYNLTREHRSQIKGVMQPRVPDWWEKEVKGKDGIIICPKCNAVYFNEHWYSAEGFAEFAKSVSSTSESLCDECKYEKGRVYEGEVTLLNLVDENEKVEILNLINNVNKRARKRDPEDRIIKIKDLGDRIIITTTENQLAISIGKQIDRAFKGGNLDIKFSHQDIPTRVYWRRKED